MFIKSLLPPLATLDLPSVWVDSLIDFTLVLLGVNVWFSPAGTDIISPG